MNQQVREATLGDFDFILESQLRMAQETEDFELNRETVSAGIRAVFADPKKGKYYVAEIKGEVAAGLLTVYEWSDWRNGNVLWIHSVFVKPEWRRRGLYGSLYRHLQDVVKHDPHLKGIRLYVDKRNEVAQGVYTRLGMDGSHYSLFEWMPED